MLVKDITTAAEFEELKALKSAGKINHEDVKLLEKSALNQAYHSLVHAAYNNEIISTLHPEKSDINAIISRDFMDEALTRLNMSPAVFSELKGHYISVCGAGYIFDMPAPILTEAEHNRLEYLNFDLGIAV